MNNIKEKVIKVMKSLTVIEGEFNDNKTLASAGIDSLQMVELVIGLEDEFNIRFDDSELDPSKLTTISDIYKLIQKYEVG
jgi:acyl carrier protein